MIGGGVGAVVVALGAYTFVVSPKASQATDLRSQTAQVNSQNLALQSDVQRLQADFAHLKQLQAKRDRIRAALPTDNAISAFTDQLSAQARHTHVQISLLTTGDIAAMTSSAAVPVPASTASTATSAAPAPVAAPATAGPAQGLYSIPVSLTVVGAAGNDAAFLQALQKKGPRAALVSSVVMSPATATGASAHGVSMALTFQVFVEAIPAAPTPSSLPATPTPAATPSPAAS
jgi:Tfp pilus assembly protein PilO